jgi:hypothetical protein
MQYDSVEVVEDCGEGNGVGSSDFVFVAEQLSGAGLVVAGF